ncbi:SpoIIE family protein phosphatase [Candidatus Peregrinibacteria bacterium]|nr:SpoIIE family protein phosphatase [Candidatus Peregrinibacteria bacterium]
MHSIKTKLLLALSLLVVFLFSVTAGLLITEKRKELALDIYTKARGFTEFAAPKIADLYQSLLEENTVFVFKREMKDIFAKNSDIAEIQLVTFAGEVLYDSRKEHERLYAGPVRALEDSALLPRVQASLPSYLLENGRSVFLKKDVTGRVISVNENEKLVAPIQNTDAIRNIVYPLGGKYAVVFEVSYKNLQARVVRTMERIALLLIFGILLGLGFGWSFSQRITTPLQQLTSGALVLAKGDFTARVNVSVHDEVGTLADTFNKMAQDLEVSTKAKIEQEKLKKELEVAAHMQKQILPKVLPTIPGLEIATELIPAAEIGGDCYDFIQISADTYLFYIGDVTGHGIPAGIVASIANAILYSYSNVPSLKDVMSMTNKVMKAKTAQNMFMTMLMLRYQQSGKLDYVSAGHPFMLHYQAALKQAKEEPGGGIAMAMVPDNSKLLKEQSVDFQIGDAIVLYSDGIPEANSPKGEQYGMQRFKDSLIAHGAQPKIEDVRTGLIQDVQKFMDNAEQLDDITLLVVRRTASAPSPPAPAASPKGT